MRTLTQVWVFLVSLTFIFLLISFQLLGRAGLFLAFLLSLLFLYAALRNSMRLFRGPMSTKPLSGNDPTGFLNEIEKNKLKFGFNSVEIHTTPHSTPPLVWKDTETHGFILINEKLLEHLNTQEIKLLSLFLLSHLECRSFVAVHILSILKIPFFLLSYFSKPISFATHAIFKTHLDLFKADIKFITLSEANKYEVGYFLNKLHKLFCNNFSKPNAYSYFSTLSLPKFTLMNEFGLPDLDSRLKKLMGFSTR